MKKKMFSNIRSRLILLIFSYLFLVIVIVTFMIFRFYSGELRNRSKVYFTEKTVEITDAINRLIDNMDTLSTQFLSSETLQQMFFETYDESYINRNYFELKIDKKKIAQDILWAFNSPKSKIENVSIFGETSYIGLRYSPSIKRIREISSLPLWRLSEGEDYKILTPHKSFWDNVNEKMVFSLYRPYIASTFGFMNVGIIEIEEDYGKIIEICEDSGDVEEARVYILDKNDNLVYPLNRNVSMKEIQTLSQVFTGESENLSTITLDNKEYQVSFSTLKMVDWKVAFLQPSEVYYNPLKYFLRKFVLTITIIALLVFVFLIFIVSTVTRPIGQLINEIDGYSLEQSVLNKSEYTIKEVVFLQSAFVRLVERLRESSDQLILANETELNLRIMNLQAKINPHFLFNSLTAISSVSMEEGSQTVPVMCFQLSELFRYTSISGNEKKSSLGDELDNIRLYMEFMKWRYEDNFQFTIEETGDIRKISVPKLILQPLIENSFTHGFKNSYPPYRIEIQCSEQSGSWLFRIRDNGGGFSDSALEELFELKTMIDSIFNSRKNLRNLNAGDKAILNIYIRLKLIYQNKLEMTLGNNSSVPGGFTEFRIDMEETR